MVLLLVVLSVGSAVFALAARTDLAMTLFLWTLALAYIRHSLRWEQREPRATVREEAMHTKLDSLLRGVTGADERLAGSDRKSDAEAAWRCLLASGGKRKGS